MKNLYFGRIKCSFEFPYRNGTRDKTCVFNESCTAQKMEFPADLITFTEEILNENFIFWSVLGILILTKLYTYY